MPRKLRLQFEGACHHVFNRGANKQTIFLDDQDRHTFLRMIEGVASRYQLRFFAYCLMGNHFHLFLQTQERNLDKSMQSLQGRYAQYVNLRYGRVGCLFQGRYQNRLVDKDSYSLTLVQYIHRNPIDSGLTTALDQYPWSSYPIYTKKALPWKWLDTKWILSQFHREDQPAVRLFKEFHARPVPEGSDPFALR
ncbi:MAG: transposase [Candidatus Omnitrophota bacterium]